jgi:hypothetical protein
MDNYELTQLLYLILKYYRTAERFLKDLVLPQLIGIYNCGDMRLQKEDFELTKLIGLDIVDAYT